MLFTKILTIAALATSAMAGYASVHPANEGSHNGYTGDETPADKAPAKKPGYHFAARGAEEHSGAGFRAKEGADDHEETHARPSSKLSTRNGGVYWCSDDNWQGSCTKSAADDSCHKWNFGPKGSFGPDPGVKCTFYDESNCKGDTTSVSYPGTGQVYYFGKDYEYYVPEAWKCHT